MSATESFRTFMSQCGAIFDGRINPDGNWHSFESKGPGKPNCSYVYNPGPPARATLHVFNPESIQSWCEVARKSLGPEDRVKLDEDYAQARAAADANKEATRLQAREEAVRIINASNPAAPNNPYLTLKRVSPCKGLFESDEKLIVPMRDIAGVIHTLQFIPPDGKEKRFLTGGKKSGSFFLIGDESFGSLVICEGLATGLSVFEATGLPVACAMDCGNILAVAEAFRGKYRTRDIIIAADDDNDRTENPGLSHAAKAAIAIKARLIAPERSQGPITPIDFNDLHQAEGLPAVALQVREAIPVNGAPPETRLIASSNGTREEYLPSDNDQHLVPVKTKPANPWPSMQDGADICAMVLPPPVEIIAGLLTEQCKFMLASSAKSYKTFMTIYMAVCIAHGLPFLGRKTIRKRVVYFNLELRPVTFWRRVQVICSALDITLDKQWFHVQSLRGHLGCSPIAVTIDRMIERIEEVEAEVAVIDPVYKLNTEGEENSSRDQTRLFNQIDRLTTEPECAVILADHFSKGSQADKDPLDAIRGSSAKGGDVDAALILRVHEMENCYSGHAALRELPPMEPVVLKFVYPLFHLRTDLDAADMKRPQPGRKKLVSDRDLLLFIKDSTRENPVSNQAWADRADVGISTLKNYLPGLRARGFTETVGEGTLGRKYISAKGREFLNQTATT